MNKNFWRRRSVLITGFEGFLGSNLTKALLSCGAKVVGLDILVGRKETILTAEDRKNMTVIKGSVTDYDLLKKIIKKYKMNVVFHLAAETIVGKCYDNPSRAFSTNIEGTWKVLEACRHSKTIQSVIIASSDKAYGSHKKLPYTENTPLIGRYPYDVSKSCADLIAHAYFHAYGLSVAITRCGNIYGPGDFNFSRIVPDAIQCAISGKELSIRSDGRFTRDYVYVEDIVNGYIVLAEKMKSLDLGGDAFNFSDENPVTVVKLVNKIFEIVENKPNFKILNKTKYEIRHQYLLSSKARKILRWKPVNSLEDSLRKTIEWYKSISSRR